ncbi:MAG: hypothetical protein L6V93_16420 [Clostridiales bacterium]|nr:MAG: hypothetical protein L6V93_16420 [Clostridiales bacterium]
MSTTAYDANSYMQRSVDVELIKTFYSRLQVPVNALTKKTALTAVMLSPTTPKKFKTVEIIYKDEKNTRL